MASAVQKEKPKNVSSAYEKESGALVSMRRIIWIGCFGVGAVAMISAAPSVLLSLVIACVFSIGSVLVARHQMDTLPEIDLPSTVSGALLSAAILWLSLLASGQITGALGGAPAGAGLVGATLIGFGLYCLFLSMEMAASFGVQLATRQNGEASTEIAYQLDKRFGGFLGELK